MGYQVRNYDHFLKLWLTGFWLNEVDCIWRKQVKHKPKLQPTIMLPIWVWQYDDVDGKILVGTTEIWAEETGSLRNTFNGLSIL